MYARTITSFFVTLFLGAVPVSVKTTVRELAFRETPWKIAENLTGNGENSKQFTYKYPQGHPRAGEIISVVDAKGKFTRKQYNLPVNTIIEFPSDLVIFQEYKASSESLREICRKQFSGDGCEEKLAANNSHISDSNVAYSGIVRIHKDLKKASKGQDGNSGQGSGKSSEVVQIDMFHPTPTPTLLLGFRLALLMTLVVAAICAFIWMRSRSDRVEELDLHFGVLAPSYAPRQAPPVKLSSQKIVWKMPRSTAKVRTSSVQQQGSVQQISMRSVADDFVTQFKMRRDSSQATPELYLLSIFAREGDAKSLVTVKENRERYPNRPPFEKLFEQMPEEASSILKILGFDSFVEARVTKGMNSAIVLTLQRKGNTK
jgi:hypothetical protein